MLINFKNFFMERCVGKEKCSITFEQMRIRNKCIKILEKRKQIKDGNKGNENAKESSDLVNGVPGFRLLKDKQ